MRIYLTGFMGSGKSTVGRILARKLHCDFIDLDQEIERKVGKSIAEIFQQFGEDQFRKWETEWLQSVQQDPAVVAGGGGCFIHNQDWMLEHGKVVYLQVPFSALAERLGADPLRPLWRNAESLFRERAEQYQKAHFTVNAVADPEAVASQITTLLDKL